MHYRTLLWVFLVAACGSNTPADKKPDELSVPSTAETAQETPQTADLADAQKSTDRVQPIAPPQKRSETPENSPKTDAAPKDFTNVATLDPSIRLDIRYATADNFTKSKIYDCPQCLLRPEAAEAIVQAHRALKKKGLALKMFDCYRPRPYQQRLWDKVPNPDYVTPPSKGSMHSRGAAVDLTIVDVHGKELDMGTPYDFFGREAHTDITDLPKQVLLNRKLLRETLESVGFQGIRTEWWHYSYKGKNWPLSDYVWPCN